MSAQSGSRYYTGFHIANIRNAPGTTKPPPAIPDDQHFDAVASSPFRLLEKRVAEMLLAVVNLVRCQVVAILSTLSLRNLFLFKFLSS